MPHRIDIDGIHQNLFILQNLVFGSKIFCTTYHINRMNESYDFNWDYYLGWLKSIVSEKLIESSIKMRILQDFLHDQDSSIDFKVIEEVACSNINIGSIIIADSVEPLTIRESCNKIIHALEMNLQWREILLRKKKKGEFNPEFWSGVVELHGKKGSKEWLTLVNVIDYCVAIERVLIHLENNIDWNHVYKYDE